MGEKCSGKISRRKFVRTTTLGATGLALGGLAYSPRKALGYVPRDQINPAIDNLRVVYVHDDALTNGTGPVSGWTNQNAATNDDVVAADLDKMACALAEIADPGEAWRTIFIKPPAKQWNEVVVAIKTNTIAEQHTRNAVMKKVCETLVNHLGVAATNIHIYDGVHGGAMPTKTPWYDLPAGVQVENTWGGPSTYVNLPAPYGGSARCVTSIADGTVDILIDIAMCKGHSSVFGSLTMCLKNHYGTFQPKEHGSSATDYLLSINKSDAILGAMDPGTGRIIHPRQQLCLIDALWASESGPSGEPSCRPNRLFMGTFAPAVDYQVATKFRHDTMGWSINTSAVNRFLIDFGYTPDDLPGDGSMIDALRWAPSSLSADRRWSEYR